MDKLACKSSWKMVIPAESGQFSLEPRYCDIMHKCVEGKGLKCHDSMQGKRYTLGVVM